MKVRPHKVQYDHQIDDQHGDEARDIDLALALGRTYRDAGAWCRLGAAYGTVVT